MGGNPRVRDAALTVTNRRCDVARALAWLDGLATEAGLSADLSGRLQVVLDEVLSNVLAHGLAGVAEGQREIGLRFRLRAAGVELEVTDDGPPFDPTQAMATGQAGWSAAQGEGGLGLVFVRALVDEAVFSRRDGRNCLVLRKRIEGGRR
jgi:anti-sigma regulatory factor (Ser/Thr protein kinase)